MAWWWYRLRTYSTFIRLQVAKEGLPFGIEVSVVTKVLDSALVVVDALSFDAPKTKEFKAVLNNLNVNEKTLVVLDDDNANAALAARNLENVTVMTAKGVNVLDVINNDKLVVVQSALAQVEEVLA